MKNKILAILLSFTLIFTTTSLSFAEDEVGSLIEPEKHSEQVVADITKKAPAEVKKEVNVEQEASKVEAAPAEEAVKQEEPKEAILKVAGNKSDGKDEQGNNIKIEMSEISGHSTITLKKQNDESISITVTYKGGAYRYHDKDTRTIQLPEGIYNTYDGELIGTTNLSYKNKGEDKIYRGAFTPKEDPKPATKYTVTYEYIGTVPEGAPLAPTAFEKEAEEIITIAQKPEFEGYTFEGWNTNDVIISDGKFEMPEKNVKLTGEWKKIKENVIIHYIDEDGNIVADDYTDTVEYGDNISQDSPLPEGYELVNEEDRTVIKENITEDFEYTVVYKKIPVPVPTPDPDNPVVGPTNGGDSDSTVNKTSGIVKTGDADACWALLNLILALATCIIAFMMIISMLMRKDIWRQLIDKLGEDDGEIEDTKSLLDSSLFERILSGVVGVFALLVLFITENMNLPMVWADRWTFIMIVIFALQILVVAFAKNKDKVECILRT